jgi:hypothetical protein
VVTPVGTARVHVHAPSGRPSGTLVLGHGAGGGIESADLVAVSRAATGSGWRVELVEQPWRVEGRKVAVAPPRLDEAWLAVLAAGRGRPAGPVVVGGRSAGARVACRTASAVGADAVLCLSFPLHPPGRPERSRAAELAGVTVPVLVVQGRRDPFGGPQELLDAVPGPPAPQVQAVDGDHSLSRSAAAVAQVVVAWLDGVADGVE